MTYIISDSHLKRVAHISLVLLPLLTSAIQCALLHLILDHATNYSMTSITQLLSPWPIAKSNSIVLRDQPEYPSPQAHTLPPLITPSYQPASEIMTAQGQSELASPSPNSPPQTSDHSDGDGPADGRKGYGKRELSTSKRAAQNRAAQVRIRTDRRWTLSRHRG